MIAARLASDWPKDASLRQMVRAIGVTLDATRDVEGAPGDAPRRVA